MVRIPSLSRRTERDENGDGRVDVRDDRIARDIDERGARHDSERRTAVLDRRERRDGIDVADRDDDRVVVEPSVRPHASGLGTLGLVLGVLAAVGVASGVLAAPGVALGLLGLLLSAGGMAATGRQHVTGRFDATLGVMLSLAAVIVGLLALSGSITWLNTETNQVGRLADWLSTQLPWLDRF